MKTVRHAFCVAFSVAMAQALMSDILLSTEKHFGTICESTRLIHIFVVTTLQCIVWPAENVFSSCFVVVLDLQPRDGYRLSAS